MATTLFDLRENLAVLSFDSTVSIPHREQVVPDEKGLVPGSDLVTGGSQIYCVVVFD